MPSSVVVAAPSTVTAATGRQAIHAEQIRANQVRANTICANHIETDQLDGVIHHTDSVISL